MGKRVIYSRSDGFVEVLSPAPKEIVGMVVPSVLSMDETAFLTWIANKDAPRSATNVAIIDESALPPRTNRNLWRWNGTAITVNGVPVSTPAGVKIR